jgi:hypothetical protein
MLAQEVEIVFKFKIEGQVHGCAKVFYFRCVKIAVFSTTRVKMIFILYFTW